MNVQSDPPTGTPATRGQARGRSRRPALLPGVTGTLRVGRRLSDLLARLEPGDIAVVDRTNMDRATADALIEAGVRGVVNARPMVSGRYAGRGPQLLAEAGVVLVEGIGGSGFAALVRHGDGLPARLHEGVVYAVADGTTTPEVLATGQSGDVTVPAEPAPAAQREDDARPEPEPEPDPEVDEVETEPETDAATDPELPEQPEQPELPRDGPLDLALRSDLDGRPVVVVATADHADLQSIRRFVLDRGPAVVVVGSATDDLFGNSWAPDVVVVTADTPASMPSPDALQVARDVVLVLPPGASDETFHDLEELGVTPHVVDSADHGPSTAEEVALLIAEGYGAPVVVGVGLQGRLEAASRLVDAAAVRELTGTGTSSRPLTLVLVVGVLALLLAIAATPVGNDWLHSLGDTLGRLL